MSKAANYVGCYRSPVASIVNAHGIIACALLWKPEAVPGMTTPAVLGSRVHQMAASTNSANPRSLNLFRGHATTIGGTNTGALAFTATTITRATGSFLTDGWRVGDQIIVMDSAVDDGGLTTLLNRRVATITAAAALTLTFAAATFTAEAIPASAILYRATQLCAASVLASAGQTINVGPANILTPTVMPHLANKPDTNLIVGPKGILFASVTVAVEAGNALTVTTEGGDY